MVALEALQEVLRKDQGVALAEVALTEAALEEAALVEVALEEVALEEVALVEVALAKVDRMEITVRTEQMLRQKLQ